MKDGSRFMGLPERCACGETVYKDMPVTLNIGGTQLSTSLDTLCRDPGSIFPRLFQSEYRSRAPCPFHCPVPIDRDGKYFRHILNYLRGSLNMPADETVYRSVKAEAEFYGLDSLAVYCDKGLEQLAREQAAREVQLCVVCSSQSPGMVHPTAKLNMERLRRLWMELGDVLGMADESQQAPASFQFTTDADF